MLRRLAFCCLLLVVPFAAHALTGAEAKAIAVGDSDARIAALNAAAANADPKLAAFVQALLDDEVKIAGDKVLVVHDGKTTDAATGAEATLPESAEDVTNNNRMRGALEAALASLKVLSPDPAVRRAAIEELGKATLDEAQLPMVEKALAAESDAQLKDRLARMRAAILISSSDVAKRLAAAAELGSSDQSTVASLLQERLAAGAETDPAVRVALQRSLDAVRGRLAWGERLGVVFTGISLGSVLLLVALGLAITYGLMGVINMAHGEFIMLGAYAAMVLQSFIGVPFLLCIPLSFFLIAGFGWLIERGLIRTLYKRPLDTLLATWGLSLILIQSVRLIFGPSPQYIAVPDWLNFQLDLGFIHLAGLRVFIIGVALGLMAITWYLMYRTTWGIQVRAVMQDKEMAASFGINTDRIYGLTFAYGAGLAGAAGSMFGALKTLFPDMGSGYIVEAFLVVVVGGVQLVGSVLSAFLLGELNSIFSYFTNDTFARFVLFTLVVIFLRFRPQGLISEGMRRR